MVLSPIIDILIRDTEKNKNQAQRCLREKEAKTEAEIGEVQPRTAGNHQKLGRSKEKYLPIALGGSMANDIDFGLPAL